jgi:hypothetical protein
MSQRKVIVGLDQLQFLSGIYEDLPDIDLNAFFYSKRTLKSLRC